MESRSTTNVLLIILIIGVVIFGVLFLKQQKQVVEVSNEWPETVPATPTNNYPNPNQNTNPNTNPNPTPNTNPNPGQTQSLRTFSKDGTPVTFQYPSRFGALQSVMYVNDGNYLVGIGSGDSSVHVDIVSTGYPDHNEIEVRTTAQYNQMKTFYAGTEYLDASGNIYFVANGKTPPCDMGVICSQGLVGVKKLPGNGYGFTYALVIAKSTNISMEEFKKVTASISILNLPPSPENAPAAFIQPGFLSYPSPTVTFNHTSSFQGELKDLYEQRLGEDFLDMAPNFASYYRIGVVGCGTSCWGHVVIDLRDGKYYKVPDGSGNAFSSQANSKLFIGVNVPNYTDYPDQALVVELEAKNREAKVKWYSFSESTKSFTYITTGYCNIMEGTNGASATVTSCIE